ncbi:hypothetical protein Tco_0608051 [Tanacetum coccineum]
MLEVGKALNNVLLCFGLVLRNAGYCISGHLLRELAGFRSFVGLAVRPDVFKKSLKEGVSKCRLVSWSSELCEGEASGVPASAYWRCLMRWFENGEEVRG